MTGSRYEMYHSMPRAWIEVYKNMRDTRFKMAQRFQKPQKHPFSDEKIHDVLSRNTYLKTTLDVGEYPIYPSVVYNPYR